MKTTKTIRKYQVSGKRPLKVQRDGSGNVIKVNGIPLLETDNNVYYTIVEYIQTDNPFGDNEFPIITSRIIYNAKTQDEIDGFEAERTASQSGDIPSDVTNIV